MLFRSCFAPVAANKDKFKAQLTTDEIELIETLAQDHMAQYGYERMTEAHATITDDTWNAARKHSDLGRQTAWTELEQNNYRDFILRRFRSDYLNRVRHSVPAL